MCGWILIKFGCFLIFRTVVENNARGAERRVPNVVSVYTQKMGGVDLSD